MHHCHSRQLRPKTMLSYEQTLKLFGVWLADTTAVTRVEDIECKYNNAHDFSDGLALVKLNGMCGFINEKGDVVVPLIYDDATDFENGQARVQRYGQWTVIDTSGKPVK